jgi:hypothetical protein
MIHLGGFLGGGDYPFHATTLAPPFKTNYIFSFGETLISLAKCDLLAKMAIALANTTFSEWIGIVLISSLVINNKNSF